jgi:hypothetical protein
VLAVVKVAAVVVLILASWALGMVEYEHVHEERGNNVGMLVDDGDDVLVVREVALEVVTLVVVVDAVVVDGAVVDGAVVDDECLLWKVLYLLKILQLRFSNEYYQHA